MPSRRDAARKPKDPPASNPFVPKDDGPSLGLDYERIIGRVLTIDAWAEFDELEGALSLDKPLRECEYTEIADALERIDEQAWRAFRLLASAQVAYDAFEADMAVVEGAHRDSALTALQEAKAAGTFTKAINNPDIDAYIATHFAEEHKTNVMRRAKAKRTVDSLETLEKRLSKRRDTLESLASRAR